MNWSVEFWTDNLHGRTHLIAIENGKKHDVASYPLSKERAVKALEPEFHRLAKAHHANGRTNWQLVGRDFQTLINQVTAVPPATQEEADEEARQRHFHEELKKLHKIADDARNGEFPPEAFRWTVAGQEIAGVDLKALAAETSRYLRANTGKVPDITPAPRLGIPFAYRSEILERVIEAEMRVEFMNEQQQAIERLMAQGTRKQRG